MATKLNIIPCAGEGQNLLKCMGNRQEKDFYPSFNMWGSGHTHYCRKCLDKIYEYYYKNSNANDKLALYYTLIQENIPFITELYDRLKPKYGKVTPNKYIQEYSKTTQKQSVWSDFSASDFKLIDTDGFANQEEMKVLVKKWGDGSKSDYDFLEETFERYTNGREELSSSEEDLFRDLCRDRLLLRKINDGTYVGDETLDKVQSRLAKIMSTLKIDRFEEKKVLTLSEQTLFEKIRLCDKNNVEDIYSKPTKNYDLNKIQYYTEKFSLRPLANMLVGHRDFSVNLDNIEEYNLE